VESADEISVLWCGLCMSLINIAKKMSKKERNPQHFLNHKLAIAHNSIM